MGSDWILRVSVPFCHKSYIICQGKQEYNHRSINYKKNPCLSTSYKDLLWKYIGHTLFAHTHSDTISIHCSGGYTWN